MATVSVSSMADDPGLTATCTLPGRRLESWTIATDDTRLTVGATDEGQLCIYEISNPADGWNWTKEPSVFPLVSQAVVSNETRALRWKFKDGKVEKADGQAAIIRFVCDDPALELRSVWTAKPGRGPIRHALEIVNRSPQPVTLSSAPWMFLEITGPESDGALTMWTFHTGGKIPDEKGVYRDAMEVGAVRRIETHPEKGLFVPLSLFDGAGKHGVYVGMEWSLCQMAAAVPEDRTAGSVRVLGGEKEGFQMTLAPGESFAVPPAFVGAYRGDVDDAGNSLRRYLFQHSMPEVLRADPTYPKVQWNAAYADLAGPFGQPCEKRYYRLIDDIARHDLGFEEVMIDFGWWEDGAKGKEPVANTKRWPSGMKKASDYARRRGIRFGLYWVDAENMATPEGRKTRAERIRRLFVEHGAEVWRSDDTRGIAMKADYWNVKGFYAMVDALQRDVPNFQWENCQSGGRIKDYGAMKRSVKVFGSDGFSVLWNRQTFHDSSFAFHPIQLMGHLGFFDGPPEPRIERKKARPRGAAQMKYAFRSISMGSPEWFIGAPSGGSDTGGPWSDEEIEAVREAVAIYKTRIRPLVRSADLYHIFPRPDNHVWDGIQYYDPAAGKGVVFIFKPKATPDVQTIKLRGLDAGQHYRVTFEDGTNPAVEKTGEELANGLPITLKGAPVSELVFLERIAL